MWRNFLEENFAPLCIQCEEPSFLAVCETCQTSLSLRGTCRLCGRSDLLPHQIDCLSCESLSTPWKNLRIEFLYSSGVANFFYQIKNGKKPELWKEWLKLLPERYPFSHRPSALVVIPNDPIRNRKLGYSSSEVLASLLSLRYGIPFRPLLIRKPQLKSQKERDRYERQSHLSQALRLCPNFSVDQYPSLLLVDDVMTTGASLWLAAEIFQREGCQVEAWIMTRVPSPGA